MCIRRTKAIIKVLSDYEMWLCEPRLMSHLAGNRLIPWNKYTLVMSISPFSHHPTRFAICKAQENVVPLSGCWNSTPCSKDTESYLYWCLFAYYCSYAWRKKDLRSISWHPMSSKDTCCWQVVKTMQTVPCTISRCCNFVINQSINQVYSQQIQV
jgi:hypothetical protein